MINMLGLNAWLSPTPLPLRHPLQCSPAGLRTEALQRTSPLVCKALVAPRPVARCAKKMFCSDYPRALINPFCFSWFAVLDPLAVAPALPIAFLLARQRVAISLLRLPPRPLPRLRPAALAAIPLPRLPRMKALLTALKQTSAPPRPSGRTLAPARRLIFAMTCRTLERAHGR